MSDDHRLAGVITCARLVHQCAPAAIALALLAGCESRAEVASETEVPQDSEVASESEGPRYIQPGAPGEPSRELDPEDMTESGESAYSDADVAFVHGMIAHHEQALRMTALVPDRTSRDDLPVFVERMDISQRDEIDLMERWLAERNEDLGEEDHAAQAGGGLMPGMLTEEEMAQLEAADGEEFDRLFLQLMLRHHDGALQMVQELFNTDGAGQDTQIFRLANHIDSDQRIEIDRMQRMLADLD